MDREQMQLVRLRARRHRGFLREDLRNMFTDDFLGNIEAGIARRGGQTIKESRIRWAAIFHAPDGRGLFIKKFKIKNWKERLKYLFLPSRAMQEWDISLSSRNKGVQIPTPVGVIEKRGWGFLEESLYVSEAIEGAQALMDFFKERFAGGDSKEGEKKRVLSLLGDTVRRIHDGRLFHADLHAGNFLIRKSGEGPLYLIDLHSARVRKALTRWHRLWNIAQLFYSLDGLLDRVDKTVFLGAYAGKEMPFSTSQPILMKVEEFVDRIKRRHQRSRAKRCLMESTLFTLHRGSGYRVYRRRDVSGETLMDMIKAHREIAKNSPSSLLKNSPKTVVSMVEIAPESGLRTCVKQHRYATVWGQIKNCFRYSKGKISWIAANELFRRGISDLKPLAYVEKARIGLLKESFFLMESPVDYLEMDRYLIKSFGNGQSRDLITKKRAFIQQFAQCIGRLHRSEIFHGDLKACNILARERAGAWDFSFIDLDAVRLATEVNSRKALKNLVQINCSIPGFLSYADRIRFLKWYLEIHPIPMRKRDLIKAVLEESRKRGVLYVSPEGDVTEGVLAR
jgi:tRNA A-37 threonylcarbamoyl transferase component Bud32